MSEPTENTPYVSRGGLKLAHALATFRVDPGGWRCADLGASTGGFTDCLLRAGADHVTCVDTAYGQLAWTIRNDPHVLVMERTNALRLPPVEEPFDLIVIDLGWTRQNLAIPAALRWTRPDGRIISLIKPHYELDAPERAGLLDRGVLAPEQASRVVDRVIDQLPTLGVNVLGVTRSPILGGAARRAGRGNAEWLVLLEPASAPDDAHRLPGH